MKDLINLSSNYKKILKEIETLNIESVINIGKYEDIIKLYNKINKILAKYECDIYDMNRLINHYKKDNNTIKLLKKLMKLKNKMILSKAKESSYWNKMIKKINKKCNKILMKECNMKMIEKGFIKLLDKYNDNWLGYWTIINIDKKGNIININLFDPNDYDDIYKYVDKKR
jgi:hypothetical protein